MAGSAKIGALMVSLGIDTAQFSAGLKKSQASLASFGKLAGTAFKAASVAAIAAGTAMGFAVKGAIDHADALSKSAQKAGVTTEALSRLAYAADFSDVSMESLTSGLGKLGKAMADAVITKTSTSATAFKALGIQITDANGKLRGSDVVFSEIADRFSRMETGATKTALAMQIFGKSGAEMIPLLNGGSAELKRMADEADRLGITISTKTGKDAERFNDTLTLIGKVLQGVTNKIMEAALPALQGLAQTLASPQFAEAVAGFGTLIVQMANGVAQAITSAWKVAKDFFTWLDNQKPQNMGSTALTAELEKQEAILRRMQTPGNGAGWFGVDAGTDDIARVQQRIAELRSALTATAIPKGPQGRGGRRGAAAGAGDDTDSPFEPIEFGAGKASKSLLDLTENVGKFTDSSKVMAQAVGDSLGGAFSRLADAVLSGNDALSETVNILMDLGKQLVSGAINSFFGNLFGGGLFGGAGIGAGAIGRGVYGGDGGFFPAVPGFEGGGYTGMGSRSGGMDGRGGFLAMLHPDETIIDHTKGGASGGGSLQVTVISEVKNGNLVPTMAKVAGEVAGQKVNQLAPLAVAKFQQDRKGG